MMPAGRYYIGDLCYVMTDEEWKECCNLFFAGRDDHGVNDGEFTLKDGRRFASYSTAYGDGTYYDQYGHSYSVDAGLIGCILESDIRAEKYENLLDLGNIVDMNTPFVTSGGRYDKESDGVIQFGTFMIETDPVYEE